MALVHHVIHTHGGQRLEQHDGRARRDCHQLVRLSYAQACVNGLAMFALTPLVMKGVLVDLNTLPPVMGVVMFDYNMPT